MADSKTMLDTSSDEDGFDDDQPTPLTSNFADKLQKQMQDKQAQPSMIPRSQAMPKGASTAADFMRELEEEEARLNAPMASHQLPKGQLKIAQQNKNNQRAQRDNKNRPNTLELLQGFAETAQQKEAREREEQMIKLRAEKEKIMAKREQIKASKIGRGGYAGPGGSKSPSKSPMRSTANSGSQQARPHPMFGGKNLAAVKLEDDQPTNSKIPGQRQSPSRIPGLSPSKYSGSNIGRGSPRNAGGSRIGGGAQRMFGQPTKSPNTNGNSVGQAQVSQIQRSPTSKFGSRIGFGAGKSVSPTRQQEKVDVRVSGHFGPTLSPVKTEDINPEVPKGQAMKVGESTYALQKTSKDQSKDEPSSFEASHTAEGASEAPSLPIFEDKKIQQLEGSQSDKDDSIDDSRFQDLLTGGDEGMGDVQLLESPSKDKSQEEESSLHTFTSQNEGNALPKKTVVRTVHDTEITNVNVDLLALASTIRRRPKANLIDEIQKQLDEIDAAIQTDEVLPRSSIKFDDDFDMKKYRPEMLAEWDFEFKKLQDGEAINIPDIDLQAFDAPFSRDLPGIDENSLPMDDSKADKLRSELEKLQNDNLNFDAGLSDDSDDLLAVKVDDLANEVVRKSNRIEQNFIEEDSPSYALPVPPARLEDAAQDKDISASGIEQSTPFTMTTMTDDEESSMSQLKTAGFDIMDDTETQRYLDKSQQLKIAQLQAGNLDTLTEHPDQEDLMSQIDALEQSNRGSIPALAQRPSRKVLRDSTDMFDQIKQRERADRKKGGRPNMATAYSTNFQLGGLTGKSSVIGISDDRPAKQAGFESLAELNLKKPRSMSQKGQEKDDNLDLFDTESSVFSALHQEGTESSLQSRENSPDPHLRGQPGVQERDVDNALDVNMINLTGQNRDFQRLVQEARAEKEKKALMPGLSIVTETEDEESKAPGQDVNESCFSLDLPKPLPKPKTEEERKQQIKELRELVTYRDADKTGGIKREEDEAFMDTVPRQRSTITSGVLEPSINTNSLLSLLITDSSLKKARTAHLYICEDRELSKSRVGLKILYEQLVKQNEMQAGAFVLLKIAKVYFCLNQIKKATETISMCVSDLSLNGMEPPNEALFWKGMIYFYSIFTKRAQVGMRKVPLQKQPAMHRDLSQMINSCEVALIKAERDPSLKIVTRFLLLKLSLFCQKERFGCDLLYITQTDALKVAQKIQNDDYYLGQIAMSEVHIDGQERKPQLAFQVLNAVIQKYPKRGEAYIKLWQLNMYLGNQLRRSQSEQQLSDQRAQSMAASIIDLSASQSSKQFSGALRTESESVRTVSLYSDTSSYTDVRPTSSNASEILHSNAERAKKYYSEAYEVVSQLLLNCDENFAGTPQQRLLLVFLSVKSLQKSGQYIQAFDLLQREFAENPAISSLMYLYGKYVVKAMTNEVHDQLSQMAAVLNGASPVKKSKKKNDFRIDQGYLGSGIGALEECLRSCFGERHAKINYYIGFAYKTLRMPLKTQEYWVKAYSDHQKNRNLSLQQANQVNMFLKEQQFFTIIGENADRMIKEKQGLRKPKGPQPSEQAKKDQVREYMQSMQHMEKIDKPNSMLFQARMEAYLIETGEDENYGKAFEVLLDQFPTFIDGYINYWHYLKYRLTDISSKQVGAKTKHADQIVDNSGRKLLDKMRECATNALMQSDATEVPTSLWVEARIIFAKQMIFEKEIGKAISILKDICYIIPPYQITGLSYIQQEEEIQQASSLLFEDSSPTITNPDDVSAEEMFMRQSDMMKARNSPTRSRINKDQPLFKKKTFQQSMFDNNNNQPRSQQVLPKGRFDLNLVRTSSDSSNPGQKSPLPRSQQYQKGKFAFNLPDEETKLTEQDKKAHENMFDQIDQVERRESKAQLDIIDEDEETKISGSHSTNLEQSEKPVKNKHLGDAFQMLDKINQLSKQDRLRSRQGSVMVNTGGMANNRMSMYRKQPAQRGSVAFGAQTQRKKPSHNRNRSLTIYNPFGFDKKIMHASQRALNQTIDQQQQAQNLNITVDGGNNLVSQSVDFQNISGLVGASNTSLMQTPMKATGGQNQKLELAYQAMLKAQLAWQENNKQLGEIHESNSSHYDDDQMSMAESRQGPVIESENFAVYSNFKFLQLIGKYCAKSKSYSDEGLKALNDYLLLLEFHRSAYTKQEYYQERSLTIFYIGSIFYYLKDYFHAVEHLLPIQEQLHIGKFYKELAASERKVSKIWRLNFNERTLNWNYFSQQNMANFNYLEEQRQATKTLQKMVRAGRDTETNNKRQTKIHKLDR